LPSAPSRFELESNAWPKLELQHLLERQYHHRDAVAARLEKTLSHLAIAEHRTLTDSAAGELRAHLARMDSILARLRGKIGDELFDDARAARAILHRMSFLAASAGRAAHVAPFRKLIEERKGQLLRELRTSNPGLERRNSSLSQLGAGLSKPEGGAPAKALENEEAGKILLPKARLFAAHLAPGGPLRSLCDTSRASRIADAMAGMGGDLGLEPGIEVEQNLNEKVGATPDSTEKVQGIHKDGEEEIPAYLEGGRQRRKSSHGPAESPEANEDTRPDIFENTQAIYAVRTKVGKKVDSGLEKLHEALESAAHAPQLAKQAAAARELGGQLQAQDGDEHPDPIDEILGGGDARINIDRGGARGDIDVLDLQDFEPGAMETWIGSGEGLKLFSEVFGAFIPAQGAIHRRQGRGRHGRRRGMKRGGFFAGLFDRLEGFADRIAGGANKELSPDRVPPGSVFDEPRRLDVTTLSRMESFLGGDFSGVRVHTGAGAAEVTKRFGAEAVTVRDHVFFAPGRFRPASVEGQKLIAHELTHVVQKGRANLDVRTAEGEALHSEHSYGHSPSMETLNLRRPEPGFRIAADGEGMGASSGIHTAKRTRSRGEEAAGMDTLPDGEEFLDQVSGRVYELLMEEMLQAFESR
jgi:uncharacterized protein DUF4157